jgi:UDP-glucuronate decarboxylase
MKRILVTGGAGFIGSHLCERLVREGHYVLSVDNLSTGQSSNTKHFLPDNQALWWEVRESLLDIRDEFPGAGIDEIYNLACPASPVAYQRDPIGTLMTCVLGARNVLDLARATGAKVLQASTSEVYGDPDISPQPETYRGSVNPIGPRACYDEGKRAAETLFFDYHRQHGTRIKVARIFNTYGPRMRADDGRVVSNFITQALRGEPVTIYGDGSQTRSFCYVDDMVDGLVRLMASGDDVTGPVNLGNPEEVTIAGLANLIGNPVQMRPDHNQNPMRGAVHFLPLPQDDPRRRCPDITLAKQLLGWQPGIALDEGLRRTVEWFRRQQSAPS